MRTPADMPRRRRRSRTSSRRLRVVLIVAAVALLLLITSLRGIAGFYTDYLWFDSLGFGGVFTGVLGAKIQLAVVFSLGFAVVLWLNLYFADRLAPKIRPAGPEEEFVERYQQLIGRRTVLVRTIVAVLFGLIVGVGTSSQWRQWLLFRNSVDFGWSDPQFDKDASFYVFKLPFYSFLVSWAFAALVIIIVITAVAHYLNGGIRVQIQGQRVTPQVKAHLSLLLGLLALLKAAGYYFQRFELTLSTRGVIDGASYTDVKAQLPAIQLLILVSLFAFVLLVYNIWRKGWVLPVIGVGLWALVAAVVGAAYPAFIQRFQVQPAEARKEAPYIQRNIEATRFALGLDDVEVIDFTVDTALTSDDLDANIDTLKNVRVIDPNQMEDTFRRQQGQQRGFYNINSLDVDRYDFGGEERTQVVVAARELNASGIPQKSWVGEHLVYTHGYGMVAATASRQTTNGSPDYVLRDVPPTGEPELTRPEIYFGEGLDNYAIVETQQAEVSYVDPVTGADVTTVHEGDGGVRLDSFFRRAAFALRFGNYNPLVSSEITDDSRIMFVRDIHDRVRLLAPFLDFDNDPYPVVFEGRILWIVDGYTTTDNFPYSQRADTETVSGDLDHGFNYVRNSVKAVVDAYNGDVSFYVIDETDPLIRSYQKAFPDLFEPASAVPPGLEEHFRYPEDLFRIQTTMFGRYHINEASQFYTFTDAWSVAQDPGSTAAGTQTTQDTIAPGQLGETREVRIDPYYVQMKLPGDEDDSYVLIRPYVPRSNDTSKGLVAFMTAKNEPGEYGRLQVFRLQGAQTDGPSLVASNISSETEISAEIALLDRQGSNVLFGNMLLIPIENSLIYVRPFYVQAQGTTAVPQLRYVIVTFDGQSYLGTNLEDALTKAFGDSPDLDVVVADGGTTPGGPDDEEPGTGSTTTTVPEETSVAQLLAEAQELFDEADAALADGDLGLYAEKIDAAREKIAQAAERSGVTTTTSTTAPTTVPALEVTSTTAPSA